MDCMAMFDTYEEQIPQIAEVTTAEENARKIYDRISVYDKDLADNMDMVIGSLARAYEAQGFLFAIGQAKMQMKQEVA